MVGNINKMQIDRVHIKYISSKKTIYSIFIEIIFSLFFSTYLYCNYSMKYPLQVWMSLSNHTWISVSVHLKKHQLLT